MSTTKRLRVLALSSYPVEAAGTRFRLIQLLRELSDLGIDVSVRPFLDASTWTALYDRSSMTRTTLGVLKGGAKRLVDLARAGRSDIVLVLREAMLLGPPVIEIMAPALGRCPLVLDLDDPTWVGYDSPTYGRFGRLLKWPGKSLSLIDHADAVTCGSDNVAAYVASRGRPSYVVPAVVDTEIFRPRPARPPGAVPVIGWVGTHSSFPYVQAIGPALATLARTRRFRLRLIGAAPHRLSLPDIEVEHQPWDLHREPADFAAFDIGLYPLPDDRWAQGKSALKSVQYLACGVPFVASPVGAAAAVGVAGTTNLLADSTSEWISALSCLLDEPDARAAMGSEGRRYALQHHRTQIAANLLTTVLRGVAG